MSNLYEIIIYSTISDYYTDSIINYLDPFGLFISHIIYRDDCYNTH